MLITTKDFLAAADQWAAANTGRIRTIAGLPGGWQAWAQAEIAAAVREKAADAWIGRDVAVYRDKSSADLLVNDPANGAARDTIIVELQCESMRNWRAFVDGLRYDTWKLGGDMAMGLGVASKVLLGVFLRPDTAEKLLELNGFQVTYTPDREIGLAILTF